MTMEERLASLERRNKYMLIGLVVLAVGWAFTSTTRTVQAQADENIVRAEKFELVDSQGHIRAELTVSNIGPVLRLYDENGTSRALLAVYDEDGPGIGTARRE